LTDRNGEHVGGSYAVALPYRCRAHAMSSPSTTNCLAGIAPAEAHQLILMARSMKQPNQHDMPLRGRHVVVLTETPDSPSDRLFTTAAAALGATVVHISPIAAGLFDPERAEGTARTLGRLYAAALCDNLGPDRTQQVANRLGIPVFDDVASEKHPTRQLGDLLTRMDATKETLPDEAGCAVASQDDLPPAALERSVGRLRAQHTQQVENQRYILQALLRARVAHQ
jgi:hypothetical protein